MANSSTISSSESTSTNQPKKPRRVARLLALTPIGIALLVGLGWLLRSLVPVDQVEASTDAATSIDDRFIENVAFGVGEKLSFDINYGFINAGTATMTVAALVEFAQRPAFQIVTTAQSNDFFSSVYKVDDRVESITDATGLFSWRFEKRLREGSYKSDRAYTFDQRAMSVNYNDSLHQLEPFTQDALSAIYFVRTQPLEVGKPITLNSFVDGRKSKLEVKVHKREKITVKAGTFDCLVVEPITADVGVFKNDGKLTIWLTDDRVRMPVLMKSKVLVGSISAELTDYELGEMYEPE